MVAQSIAPGPRTAQDESILKVASIKMHELLSYPKNLQLYLETLRPDYKQLSVRVHSSFFDSTSFPSPEFDFFSSWSEGWRGALLKLVSGVNVPNGAEKSDVAVSE